MIFLALCLSVLLSLIVNFPIAAVFFLVWKFIILSIFPAWPVFTYWQMYGITLILTLVGSFFRSSKSSSSD